MTYTDKPHGQRYTGRGLGWAKKPITKRRAGRVARYLAGVMIVAAVKDGYLPEDLEERFGEEGAGMIRNDVAERAARLMDTGEQP